MIDELESSDDSKEFFQKLGANDEEIEEAVSLVYDELIDEVVLGLCFEVHKSVKLGILYMDEMDEESEKKYQIVDEVGLDVFGQVPAKKQFECVCPNCQRNLAASRFAPHLEKCMGMGRNSSRIASRRIASSGKDVLCEDDESDDDWTYTSDRKVSKKKKNKHDASPRRSKHPKLKNCDVSGSSSLEVGSAYASYDTMSFGDRKALLMQMCGVISEHTKKMCTRSHRCPQHSDEQRKQVRSCLLGRQGVTETSDDVDIDTYDDGEAHSLRDTLHKMLATNGSHDGVDPTTITITNAGSLLRRKDTRRLPPPRSTIPSKVSRRLLSPLTLTSQHVAQMYTGHSSNLTSSGDRGLRPPLLTPTHVFQSSAGSGAHNA